MNGQTVNDFYNNLIFPRNTMYQVPNSFDINKDFGKYTPAMKMMLMDYTDPLVLNFKVMLNPYQKTGLLAGADKMIFDDNRNINDILAQKFPTDSAISFLLRTGKRDRAILLVRWIQVLFDLIRNYEFLVMDVEGLDEIIGKKPETSWEDSKIKINFRETSDSRVQSLIGVYNEIWYDNTLNHVILPSNLRSIDMSILVFNAGYYNSMKYDSIEDINSSSIDKLHLISKQTDKEKMERLMFPTINKLNTLGNFRQLKNDGTEPPQFIYHMFTFSSSTLNIEDTGKEYFSTVSNEQGNSEPVKTSLVFSFSGCQYSNCFTNTFGYLDIPQVLLAMTRIGNTVGMGFENDQIFKNSYESIFTDRIFNNWGARFKDSWKGIGDSLLTTAMNLSKKYVESARLWANNIADSIISITDPSLLSNLTERSLIKLMSTTDSKVYELFRVKDINNLVVF
jgi:hypothetical protein